MNPLIRCLLLLAVSISSLLADDLEKILLEESSKKSYLEWQEDYMDSPVGMKKRKIITDTFGFPKNLSEKSCIPADAFFEKFWGTSKVLVTEKSRDEDGFLIQIFFAGEVCTDGYLFLRVTDDPVKTLSSVVSFHSSEFKHSLSAFEPMEIGGFGLQTKSGHFLAFIRKNLYVDVCFKVDDKLNLRNQLMNVAREIDALLCGEAEFLPKDAPELAEIRKAWEHELERHRQKSHEDYLKRQQEWMAQERKRKAEELKTLSLAPTHQRETYKNLETRFELLKNHLKPRRVPAGTRDPDAWKKLSLKTVEPLFTKYEFSEKGVWHPFNFGFSTWRKDKEFLKVKPRGVSFSVEIAHAKDFAQAWDWALYFRLKYSAETEQRARLSMSQLAQATNQNAFPRLGDINISWRGRMDSSFLPEEETAESLIIFIRGTTVVCVRSERTDSSALPLARLLDKQLVDGTALEPDEFYLPSTF